MIYIDFETYSECELKSCGTYIYSKHPTTEVLCMAFAIDDEPIQLWTPLDNKENGVYPNLAKLFERIQAGDLVEAYNAFFERCIWQNVAMKFYGFPQIQQHQWRCSAALVSTLALPRSLEDAAKYLECKHQKDLEGKNIMLKLCKPKRPTKNNSDTRYKPEKYPEEFQDLYDYCMRDVEAEREISKKLRQLSDFEQRVWFLDQTINERGIPIDREAVEIAWRMGLDYTAAALDKIRTLTDGEITSFKQVEACRRWVEAQGCEMERFNKHYLSERIKDETLPEKVKELIYIRQANAKTSTAKYEKMLACIDEDGRIKDNYMYHGASTGRWTGKNVQFQNLPRGKIKDMDTAIEILKLGSSEFIEACYGISTMDFLSSALRGMIAAPEGKTFYVADYAAIEARGVAWISGQEDLLEDFRNNEKVYEKQAAATYNVDVSEIKKDSQERMVGKELILACGYGMGPKKFHIRCEANKIILTEDFCERAVASYRKKNHMIVKQWYAQERAAALAVRTGKAITEGKVTWFVNKQFLYCKLPSGRCLAYYKPILEVEVFKGMEKDKLSYMGERMADGLKIWGKINLYGGLIVENIVQATCRDLVAYNILNLEASGYKVIMHSHDEVMSETPETFGTVEKYEELMCGLPAWASDFPIKAEGWKGKRYKK